MVLDGDALRKTLSPDLGFDEASRQTHLRRTVTHVKQLKEAMPERNVIVALISPYQAGRQHARDTLGSYDYIEIYNCASLATCVARDPKGLYARAIAGEISNMTGISHPYEAPTAADFVADAERCTAEENANQIISLFITDKVS